MAVNTQFGRLWPYCDVKSSLVTVVAPISKVRFPVHPGIAPIVAEGLRRQEFGIGCTPYLCNASSGAFNCRAISGTNSPSNHSGGLAFDIRWNENPYRCGAFYTMPQSVVRMWEDLGFYWGGHYCDYMHYEWLRSPAAAAAKVKELAGGAITPIPTEQRKMEEPVTIIQLDRTPAPPHKDGSGKSAGWIDQTDVPSENWPMVEEVIHVGFSKGWHGKVIVRYVTGPGGGHLYRAHFDCPDGKGGVIIEDWVKAPGGFVEPPNKHTREVIHEIKTTGPMALMITHASPWGKASVALEYES